MDPQENRMDVNYTFVPASDEEYQAFSNADTQHLFMKWSLKSHFKVQSYVFNEPFQVHQKQEFVLSFFKNENIVKTLLRLQVNWVPVGVSASAVEVEAVPCSVVSMSAFAPLTDPGNGLVAPGGRIVGCDHDYGQADGFLIADQLRKALLDPESDSYSVVPIYLRQECIFKIFQFLCLGGQWCQYEDDIQPYLDTAKKLYKDLVRVHKNAGTNGEVSVSLVVLRVVAKDRSGAAYYPSDPDHLQNFAYLVVDPARHHVTAFHHQFQGPYVP